MARILSDDLIQLMQRLQLPVLSGEKFCVIHLHVFSAAGF